MSASRSCGATTCATTDVLRRWASDGTFDGVFGGGGTVVVRRYTAAGALDISFGSGGSVSIPCVECGRNQVWLSPAPNGRTVVELQWSPPAREGAIGSSLGGQVSFTRLTAAGRPEHRFGDAGTVTIKLGLRGFPGQAAVTPKGALLLGSVGCCSGIGQYLVRVSKTGRVDHKFGRAAARSLARLSIQGETSSIAALLPRANGTIDVVGGDGFDAGFDLRLKADGDRARFGRRGLRRLSFIPEAAPLGANGAVFAIGNRGGGTLAAFRLPADGRVDPAFGSEGIEVPLSGSGYSLGTPTRGKVLVFGRGFHECRLGCALTPGIARFSEGSAKR